LFGAFGEGAGDVAVPAHERLPGLASRLLDGLWEALAVSVWLAAPLPDAISASPAQSRDPGRDAC
jgi:hypothetical protein